MAKELDEGVRRGACGTDTTVELIAHGRTVLTSYWPCSLSAEHDGPHEAYSHDSVLLASWPKDPPNHRFIAREQ